MKELYINRQRCDLNDKVSFALQFKSPIMATQDYLLQNRTSTIKLPATANNRRIFEFINKVEVISQVPYRKLTADYYVNGVQVVKNGQATILSVSNSEIEITIAWGYSLVFTQLFNKPLRELAIANSFYWGSSTPIGGTPTDIYMPYCLPNGTDASKHNPWIKESYLIDQILGSYGAGVTDYGAYIYLPTRNKESVGLSGTMESNISASYGLVEIQPVDSLTSDGISYDDTELYGYYVDSTYYGVEVSVGIENAADGNGVRALEVSSIDGQGNIEVVSYVEAEPFDEYGYVGYPATLSAYNITLEVGKRYRVRAASSFDTYSYWSVEMVIGGGETASFNSYFPISKNLPDISCGAMIKAYMQRHNLFYDVDTDGVIKFVRIDDIFAKIDNGEIVDWSDKVQTIDAVNFSIDGFAQKNICTYKEDADYGVASAFAINSELLDKENTFVEVELTPPPQTTGVVTIDHYTEGGAFTPLESDTAYVCNVVEGEVDGTITNIASFTLGEHAQTFDILIEDYYEDYIAVVNQPKLFAATLHLTDSDLAGLKYNQPIYMRQTGQYCLIQSIDVRDNGVTGTFIVLPHSPANETPDPTPQQGWREVASLTSGIAAAVSATYNGNLLVTTGFIGTVNSPVAYTNEYNPTTNTWASKAVSPLSRHSAGGGVQNSRLYVSGGRVGTTPQSALAIYDIATDSWSTAAAMRTAASEVAGAAIDSKVFIFGGRASYGNPYNYIQVYDISTGTWSQSSSMAIGRRNFSATVWGGEIAIAGGYTSSGGTMLAETYDPVTLTNTSIGSLPTARWDNALAATSDLYTIGGESASGRLDEFLRYNSSTGLWEQLETPTVPITKAVLEAIGTSIILVGGDTGSTTLTQCKIYNP